MKLQPRDVALFLKQPAAKVAAVLFYGPDAGLASEYAKQVRTTLLPDAANDPFRYVELSLQSFQDRPTVLADELTALSLMGGNRVVCIRAAADAMASAMKECLPLATLDSFLIVTAGDLAASSSLRAAFEEAPNAYAVGCYPDEDAKLSQVMLQFFRERGKTMDGDAVEALANQLGNNRQVTLQELEKLDLYVGNVSRVTLEDVDVCCRGNDDLGVDDLLTATFSGDARQTDALLTRLLDEGVNEVAMLRMANRYAEKLYALLAAMSNGISADQAIQNYKPKVFFRQVPHLQKQLRRWKPASIVRAMEVLVQAEQRVKSQYEMARLICQRCFISLSKLS